MVLNDAGFSPDSSPPSDRDPYSSSSSNSATSSIQIDTSKIPKPVPILGPLFGYNQTYLAHTIENRIRAASKVLKRPTTQDESEALAFWSGKMQSIASWGRPVGLAAGWIQAYRTAEQFRFPFIKPNPEFNRYQFYFGIKGEQARMLWNALRVGCYSVLGVWFGGIVVGSYAATVAAVGEQRDPRLTDLINAIAERVRQHGPLRTPPTDHHHHHQNEPRGFPSQQHPGYPRPQSGSSAPAAGMSSDDDASPTAGGFGDDTTYSDVAALSKSQDTSVMSDQQMQGLQTQRQATVDKMRANRYSSSSPPPSEQSPTSSSSSSTNRGTTFFDDDPRDHADYNYASTSNYDEDDDDMSPTANTQRRPPAGAADATSGSVWDRIRRESAHPDAGHQRGAWSRAAAAAGASRTSEPNPDEYPPADRQPATNTWAQRRLSSLSGGAGGSDSTSSSSSGAGDSFTFSSTDEDRQLAQNEAQRDFDQRLERERQGGDFSSSQPDGAGKGWRRW
ncbi:hypothetical protein L228DRAFT_251068 [Xylona heveae TC161]|uniref:Uncharacterized protein n=1 Tax=Xylona heveae (strain CBS 132557 / TC161) TaxID=1328760 RepID=A0A164ZT13_XYLHT|nr:hypothetical protein L228DRAFT_251068 [Xylona heveae TC161]KZF19474.1 hypothetical protein L228DRAFT_251068 [Xylona heveae TC161]